MSSEDLPGRKGATVAAEAICEPAPGLRHNTAGDANRNDGYSNSLQSAIGVETTPSLAGEPFAAGAFSSSAVNGAASTPAAPAPTRLSDAALNTLRARIDARLEQAFPAGGGVQSPLTGAIRHGLLSPGKRLRPVITLLACEQCGGAAAIALEAAAAVEMVHAASLIMDDLPAMDDAKLRRGTPAAHVAFGEGPAMLAVITLLSEAYRVLAAIKGLDADRRLAAVSTLADAVGLDGLAGGQERDLACCGAAPETAEAGEDTAGDAVALADMELRHRKKTGALFAAAAAIGAQVAGASPRVVAAMSDYGAALGLAYQAFDDLADCAASPDVTGKDAFQDAGKSTVASLLGRDGAAREGARWIRRAVELAEAESPSSFSPLGEFARQIGEKFGEKFGADFGALSGAASGATCGAGGA